MDTEDDAEDRWMANLKDAVRILLQAGHTQQGLAVQACVTMLEDDSDDEAEFTDPAALLHATASGIKLARGCSDEEAMERARAALGMQ